MNTCLFRQKTYYFKLYALKPQNVFCFHTLNDQMSYFGSDGMGADKGVGCVDFSIF